MRASQVPTKPPAFGSNQVHWAAAKATRVSSSNHLRAQTQVLFSEDLHCFIINRLSIAELWDFFQTPNHESRGVKAPPSLFEKSSPLFLSCDFSFLVWLSVCGRPPPAAAFYNGDNLHLSLVPKHCIITVIATRVIANEWPC